MPCSYATFKQTSADIHIIINKMKPTHTELIIHIIPEVHGVFILHENVINNAAVSDKGLLSSVVFPALHKGQYN